MSTRYRSGIVALVGRPNVGKSTLLNRLVGQKVSITSRKAQTTRQRILGISTTDTSQVVYVDTPGIHSGAKKTINRYMNRSASGSMVGVDCIVLMIEAGGWTDNDRRVLELVRKQGTPIVLVINKLDRLESRGLLLPLIDRTESEFETVFSQIVPISAKNDTNIDELKKVLETYILVQDKLFPGDEITDRSDRFLVAELIREQVFRNIEQEVPHAVAVGIEAFRMEKKVLHIEAVIWVEKAGQKGILIGKKGERLKLIGKRARQQIEKLLGNKVYLNLWVKVRENWRDNEQVLRTLGFGDE
ncbi:MAG: GTPase Era [Gammaproteobacteria bacterium]|nr:MAG: GTPase Era [Gammaproteobacteria bacterium]